MHLFVSSTYLDGFCEGADLIDLEQEGVTGLLIQSSLDASWVGDQQVIANDLGVHANTGSEVNVSLPVILVEGI